MPAPETNWMHETLTNAEKRDCANRWAVLLDCRSITEVQPDPRDIAILKAIRDDYDFRDRQQEMTLG